MDFNAQKQKYLGKLQSGQRDKSKKGHIDEEIKELVNAINKQPNYYTTSSCSGRILLYSTSPDRKKNETKWIFVSHNVVSFQDIEKVLEQLPNCVVFFCFEPLILHVVCRDLDAADNLLQLCNISGLKHSGIISLSKRIIIEIVGNERLDSLIAVHGKLFITISGISFFIDDANEKMKRNLKRIEKLKSIIIKL